MDEAGVAVLAGVVFGFLAGLGAGVVLALVCQERSPERPPD